MMGPTIASGVILNQNILHEYMALSDSDHVFFFINFICALFEI